MRRIRWFVRTKFFRKVLLPTGQIVLPVAVGLYVEASLYPGAYLLKIVGLTPATNEAAKTFALLFSWSCWVTAVRLPALTLGRIFGVTGPETGGAISAWGPPWKTPYAKVVEPVLWFLRQFKNQATAGWMSFLGQAAREFRKDEGVPLARLTANGLKLLTTIGYSGRLHINICGPSGSGKSATIGSMIGTIPDEAALFAVDVDGALLRAFWEWLESRGHKVIALDPNGLTRSFFTGLRGRWNPIRGEFDAAFRRGGPGAVIAIAKELGSGLVKIENHLQPTFDNGAKDFLAALALYVWLFRDQKDLLEVRRLLCMGLPEAVEGPEESAWERLLFEMEALEARYKDGEIDDRCGGKMIDVIVRAAATMRGGKNSSGENPFRGSAMRATSFLDSLGLAEISEDNQNGEGLSFTCEEIKREAACIFVVAPLTAIQSAYAPWIRALTVVMAAVFQSMPGLSGPPALVILDEAPSLGRLPQLLETGVVGFRKYNIRLIACFQDLPTLAAKSAYPDTWESVISNAYCTLWMGITDLRTKRYVSDLLGRCTRREKVEGAHWIIRLLGLSAIKPKYQNFERLLMDPERVGDHTSSDHGRIVITGKHRPYAAAIEPYWKVLPVWRYASDPSHPETLPRRFTRWVIASVKERRRQANKLKVANAAS